MNSGRVVLERAGDGTRTHAERLPGEILDGLAAAALASAWPAIRASPLP